MANEETPASTPPGEPLESATAMATTPSNTVVSISEGVTAAASSPRDQGHEVHFTSADAAVIPPGDDGDNVKEGEKKTGHVESPSSTEAAEAPDAAADLRAILSDSKTRRSVTFSSKIEFAIDRESHLTLSPAQMRQGSFMNRRSQWPKSLSERPRERHMDKLMRDKQESVRRLFPIAGSAAAAAAPGREEAQDVEAAAATVKDTAQIDKATLELHSNFVKNLHSFLSNAGVDGSILNNPPMEIRLVNVSYQVPSHGSSSDGSNGNKIATVYNTSLLYKLTRFTEWLFDPRDAFASIPSSSSSSSSAVAAKKKDNASVTNVLSDVNLVLQPQKMYLILGPPLSGKTSLLKAIAGMLPQGEFPAEKWAEISKKFAGGGEQGDGARNHDVNDNDNHNHNHNGNVPENKFLTGQILYNNLLVEGDDNNDEDAATAKLKNQTLYRNLVAFVRQNDAHSPRFTVGETFTFSGSCKTKDSDIKNKNINVDEGGRVGLTLKGLGLAHVKDTFVGNEVIRGVSGGQRRRVTLGEMMTFNTPLLCGDEISTGLDTASTVDILRILSYLGRLLNRVTVVSLLQPSPEAVSLFDEIILLSAGGHVIYTGPAGEAVGYFRDLGYVQPDGMDDADFLLAVASSDRNHLFRPDLVAEERENEREEDGNDDGDKKNEHEEPAKNASTTNDQPEKPHTPESFAEIFQESKDGLKIADRQQQPWKYDWSKGDIGTTAKGEPYDIESFKQKYQNSFIMSVWLNMKRSFILWTRDRTYIRASAIKNIAMGLSVGAVFFETDVNSSFFGVLFQGNLFIMLGAMTAAPENLGDRAIFYKHADSNFYPALSYVIGQALALVPQMILDVILFGTIVYWMVGFTATASGFFLYLALFFSFNFTMGQSFGVLSAIAPSKTVVQAGGAVILLFNVLFCGFIISPDVIPDYYIWLYWMVPLSWVYRALLLNEYRSDDYSEEDGDLILKSFGFTYRGEPFQREWIGYCYAYLIPFLFVCMAMSACFLHFFRMEPTPKGQPDEEEDEVTEDDDIISSPADDAFTPVDLSFTDLCYDVKSSVGSEKLRLLSNVSGVFSGGRMCALMGESGAGKTTLMDVIALRKEGGEISGEVLLNGFPQEEISFRRCSGYVEQFDVQSAELTVRETIKFSAQLRLDKSNPVYHTKDGLDRHIDYIIKTLELANEAEALVGADGEGGLTFEQRKRLSIAVELAASPSIVFLDEPTSGLDARAALLVMKALRKMCNTGRTIVATIHQPSSAVFDMFDDLLLLKKGGEVVFFGDLGTCSCNLISYFEGLGCTPINRGENPSTWMLNVLGEKITMKDESGGEKEVQLDFASEYKNSENYRTLQGRLEEIAKKKKDSLKITYSSQFAASARDRDNLMAHRLVTIYWRSPAYNLTRITLSVAMGFIMASSFIPIRAKDTFSETEMTSMLSTIFLSFIIIGVLSITSVLPVMNNIRNMYYRHKTAGMLDGRSVGRALATAEWRFIVISSFLFCLVYLPIIGIANQPDKSDDERIRGIFAFWGFFTFNIAIYSYSGQLFMCLVRGSGTAMILASVFLGMNNFFSGLIVRPQQMTGLWVFTYWITHGHYVYEGLTMSMFAGDVREVIVNEGSDYWSALDCDVNAIDGDCVVTANDYVTAFFGDKYSKDHIGRNLLILGFILVVIRASTFLALRLFIYSGK